MHPVDRAIPKPPRGSMHSEGMIAWHFAGAPRLPSPKPPRWRLPITAVLEALRDGLLIPRLRFESGRGFGDDPMLLIEGQLPRRTRMRRTTKDVSSWSRRPSSSSSSSVRPACSSCTCEASIPAWRGSPNRFHNRLSAAEGRLPPQEAMSIRSKCDWEKCRWGQCCAGFALLTPAVRASRIAHSLPRENELREPDPAGSTRRLAGC